MALPQVDSKIVNITPAMAEKWLKGYHNIRPISWGQVDAFANDMRAGNWRVTHQGIAFDENGNLVDGGHRLHAIQRAGVAVPMLVTTIIGIDIKDPIDRGRPRSIGSILGMRTALVAAVNGLRSLEVGYEVQSKMTLAETEEIYSHHQEAFEALNKGSHMIGAVLAACVWTYPIAPEKVVEFVEQVRRGEHIGRGDPAWALRWWKDRNKGLRAWNIMMATLNCARHFVTDKKINSVYVTPAGYRGITGRRRALKVPNTPTVELVPTGHFVPSRTEEKEQE